MTTTGSTAAGGASAPGHSRQDAIAVPLSIFLWVLVAVALAYGVISTLNKVVQLFS
jgi:hypothetical protein